MRELHAAALKRAYRTLAQGLGSSAVVTALVAVVTAIATDADTIRTALLAAAVAVGTAVAAAAGSFWQAVAQGLPEVLDPGEMENLESLYGALDEGDPLRDTLGRLIER